MAAAGVGGSDAARGNEAKTETDRGTAHLPGRSGHLAPCRRPLPHQATQTAHRQCHVTSWSACITQGGSPVVLVYLSRCVELLSQILARDWGGPRQGEGMSAQYTAKCNVGDNNGQHTPKTVVSIMYTEGGVTVQQQQAQPITTQENQSAH